LPLPRHRRRPHVAPAGDAIGDVVAGRMCVAAHGGGIGTGTQHLRTRLQEQAGVVCNVHPKGRDGSPRRPAVKAMTNSASVEARPPGVLVVDDDAEIVDVLAEALGARGYRVLRARDGKVAMRNPSDVVPDFGPLTSIDVVITDLVMPGTSGVELIRHLRTFDPSLPMIAITGLGDAALRTEAIRLGASIVLHKPFELEHLLRLVTRLAPMDRAS
jgi:CheY-like chemotaxis protein